MPEVVPTKGARSVEALKKEATSVRHQMTHTPKNFFCRICRMAKAQRKQARDRSKMDPLLLGPPPTKRGEQVTCDHLVTLDSEDIAIDGSRYGLLCRDRATKYLMVYPQALRNTNQTRKALAMFQGRVKIKMLHSKMKARVITNC